ncbi:MAG TPA: 50S ribosomal protein L10 [Saprospiraceae bacterium]|nr:50S ribosomal protein L10 [Saprospiraceae bacterium]MCC6688366.1 50S ribosomal protein L10 [Saprospiraceae bacterium]HMV23189.1 50S ribosomal protein L10 [Saprospiraceae bacterium]HMW75169.1 50S ribosomal protein L10 [Saprospiraceae bacterium]HMX82905.1 50S ribosomal protein L10 [Saprospiraceae bacterium]
MNKSNKGVAIEELKEKLETANFFYITDSSSLSVEKINNLRRICFNKGVEMKVVKNTLLRKAMESFGEERGYQGLFDALHGPTAIMFTETANVPAKIIKEFRKDDKRPIIKAAYIDTAIFMGDQSIEDLVNLKSKEQLIGEVITILQSPAKNVISALKSGGQTIAGLVKALEERAEQ